MQGIVFPEDWRKILEKEVIERPLKHITPKELRDELLFQLKNCLEIFKGKRFCLSLSGGLDSSILAVLLKRFLGAKFTAITVGSNVRHPDISYAEKVAEKFGLIHRVFSLMGTPSEDTYDDLFEAIRRLGFHHSINGDTVDEMLGGYRVHTEDPRKRVFDSYWRRLAPFHLDPMTLYSQKYNISVALPYMAAHGLLRRLKMNQRATRNQGKIILRQLAEDIGIPDEIIHRRKIGLCSIWEDWKEQ